MIYRICKQLNLLQRKGKYEKTYQLINYWINRICAFILGARYSIKNIYIETLEPQEVPVQERDGSNFYYAIYSEFFKNAIIY